MLRRVFYTLALVAIMAAGAVSVPDAGATPVPRQTSRVDTTDAQPASDAPHPNDEPYRTDRSVGYHILALPAYVVHGVTRPLGWAVKYLETNYPSLFLPKAPIRGVRPIVEFGGPVGVSGGLLFYDKNVWGSPHDVRLQTVYGLRSFYEIELGYDIPEPFGPETFIAVESNFFTNPEDRFFLQGNDSDRETDEGRFFIRQFDADVLAGYPLTGPFFGQTGVTFERTNAKPGDGDLGELLPPTLPGLQTINSFLSIRQRVSFDIVDGPEVQGTEREARGTRVIASGRYTHDLTNDRFRHVRVSGEIQQFVPLGGVLDSRRLAFRARIEAVEAVAGGENVPFYRLPRIGGQSSIRGFIGNRFVDDNNVSFNLEYRYPMWGFWDAVLFVDAGQVFESFDDIAADRLRFSYGGGFHILSGTGLLARFEIAGSTEGVQTVLTVSPMFGE